MTPLRTKSAWYLKAHGYEFCNCDFGCGCNFGGFPTSKDGSCRAFVGLNITAGACGRVDLSGVKCASILDWPKAIHEGNGTAVFIVEPSATDKQVEALGAIFPGQHGGLPWEILGPTYKVAGLVKANITIEGRGRKSVFRAAGVGEGRGDTLKNPVTGEDHLVDVHLPDGFIWKNGQCGQGSFRAAASGLSVSASKTNWVYYRFSWSNR
jgi:hypothetical protein